jgi:hypothetical protein
MLLVLGGAVLLLLVVIAVAILATQSSLRPQWLFRESLSPRRDVFDAGVSIFRDHTFLGAGPGTFGLLYPEYSGAFPIHAVHAHNASPLPTTPESWVGGARVPPHEFWLISGELPPRNAEQRLLAVACAMPPPAVHNLADAANIWKAASSASRRTRNRRQELPLGRRPP